MLSLSRLIRCSPRQIVASRELGIVCCPLVKTLIEELPQAELLQIKAHYWHIINVQQ